MNTKSFHKKAILKGISAFLTLAALSSSVFAQSSYPSESFGRDAALASFDRADQNSRAQAQAASLNVANEQSTLPPDAERGFSEEYIVEPEIAEPDGLILNRLNNAPASQIGSAFLGAGSFFINGYAAQGLRYGNTDGDYYAPMGMNDKEGYQLNQLYLSIGRKVEKGDRWSLGGQIDLMYGTDYYYMSSAGLENRCDNSPHWNSTDDNYMYRAGRSEYGCALPQAFAELYAPIMGGVDVKVGHFYSVMGYESLESNRNFFYSNSYARMYGMPTSMTGAVATLGLVNGWSLVLGGVNEWNAFDSDEDNFSGVFGLTYEGADKFFTFSATLMYGKQCAPCYQFETYSDAADVTVFNTFAKFQFTQRLSYVCEFTAGYDDRDYFEMATFGTHRGRAWFGLNNYLFYQVCDTLTLGTRFEWFNDADSTVIDGGYGFSTRDEASNYFALTVGANWTPLCWMTIRPEIRYDFSDWECGNLRTYDGWTDESQVTVGADIIVRF